MKNAVLEKCFLKSRICMNLFTSSVVQNTSKCYVGEKDKPLDNKRKFQKEITVCSPELVPLVFGSSWILCPCISYTCVTPSCFITLQSFFKSRFYCTFCTLLFQNIEFIHGKKKGIKHVKDCDRPSSTQLGRLCQERTRDQVF